MSLGQRTCFEVINQRLAQHLVDEATQTGLARVGTPIHGDIGKGPARRYAVAVRVMETGEHLSL